MKTITCQLTEKSVKHHPSIANACKRKRKRFLRRCKKMGIKTFLTPEITEYEH